MNLIRPTRRILIFLRACIRDVQHVLEQYGDSSQAGNKTERRSNEPVQVRAVVAFDDKARQDTKAEAERQYRAQNSIKNATWCAFLAAIVYAGIAAYQASEMRKATKAAQESADAATKQLEMIDRAWIKVTNVKPRRNVGIPSLSFQDISHVMPHLKYQAFLNYEVHTKNVGRSPTLNIQIFPELYILPFDSDKFAAKVTAEEKRYCDSYEKRQDPGTIVFPDEPGTTYGGVGQPVYEEAITHLCDHPDIKYIAAVLIGCVSYQYGASTRNHQTRFVYGIYHAHGTLFFVEGQDVSADDLKLERIETDDYAN